MERHDEALVAAKQYVRISEHMLLVTYKITQEPKILVGMVENLFLAAAKGIHAVLLFERTYKRVPMWGESFAGKIAVFQDHVVGKHGFTNADLELLTGLQDMVVRHKESPVEFSRKKEFIMCDNDYHISKITAQFVDEHIKKTAAFLRKVEGHIHA
ncbi:MAG TPA: hypothetical protein VK158_01170 [Acidobacteriota bacterium]|nr:hypothetical protein [Acidobacteriota bacterium]